jgi:hypothetical protein
MDTRGPVWTVLEGLKIRPVSVRVRLGHRKMPVDVLSGRMDRLRNQFVAASSRRAADYPALQ